MSLRVNIPFRMGAAFSLLLVAAGGTVAARPLVHLVRRTRAEITARSEWSRWVRSDRVMAGIGEPAGWMTIASAGIDTLVLWGDTGENLQRYPCLSVRSISFDQPEVVKVVAAHRDTHFRRLGRVNAGDVVRVYLKGGRVLKYRICDVEVLPKDLAAKRIAEKDGEDWLVLITCHPFSFVGSAPDRLLVWARSERSRPFNYEVRTTPTLRAGGRPFSFLPPSSHGKSAFTSLASSLPSGRAAPFAIPATKVVPGHGI
jgi:sortase A